MWFGKSFMSDGVRRKSKNMSNIEEKDPPVFPVFHARESGVKAYRWILQARKKKKRFSKRNTCPTETVISAQ